MSELNELRDKCRTCRFLARHEANISSGYCWQCDNPVRLMSYETFPNGSDPTCQEITGCEDSVWEPSSILAPYFAEGGGEVKLVPISEYDFDAVNAVMQRLYGKKVERASYPMINADTTNPQCGNYNKIFNGHFRIDEVYCPRCGAILADKPTLWQKEATR